MIRTAHRPGNVQLRKELGLQDGQMRTPYDYKNLWWSFNGGLTAFGYGDMNQADFNWIREWILGNNPSLIFTGWNEHHDTSTQQTTHPMVRITRDGITHPHREMWNAQRETRK